VIAYIDGSTGGMMLQLAMAGLVGGFVAFKLVARSFLSGIFGRFRGAGRQPDDDASVDDKPDSIL
jgi:hypothetical protein